VRNTTSVLPPRTAEQSYHPREDLADDAIGWLHRHRALEPDASPDSPIWVSLNAQMDSRSLAADRAQAGPTATNLPILSIRCSGLPNLSDQ
jgi:hypothetical protein